MIICEIGLNHMGDERYVKEYVKNIINAKADGVLFHIREKSFYEQYPELELSDQYYKIISKILKKNKIKFGITLADPEKIKFCEKLNVDFYKIFSKDILYEKLVKKIISTKKKVFVSTGMSNISEINKFINLTKNNKKHITLIHTQLDNSIEKVNLKAILLLKEKFKMNVGYGNHASNIFTTYTAIAYEPTDLLFYVKGQKVKKHIDDPHAVKLKNLKEFIKNLNELKKSIGKKTKIKMKANIK
jgi:N,N'-diacetyllegionaminate synthase